jgi:hypothetical protein
MNEIDYFARDPWYPVGHQPTQYQIYCWEYMKEYILNPIRRYVDVPVIATNVVRLASDYDRLVAAGYKPSQTSDHYAGLPVKLPAGRLFCESTFAADFTFAGDMKGLCRDIYRQANDEILPKIDGLDCDAIGQLIYEGQAPKGKPVWWIHIGLAEHVMYSIAYAQFLRAQRNKDRWLEFKHGTISKTRFE